MPMDLARSDGPGSTGELDCDAWKSDSIRARTSEEKTSMRKIQVPNNLESYFAVVDPRHTQIANFPRPIRIP